MCRFVTSGVIILAVWNNSSCFQFFDRRTPLFEEDAVTAVGTPDIHIDLHLLLTPCTLIRDWQKTSFLLLDRPFRGPERDTEDRGLWDIGSACKFKTAFPAFPDTCAFPVNSHYITFRTPVVRSRDLFHLCDPFTHESSVSTA